MNYDVRDGVILLNITRRHWMTADDNRICG